MANNERAKAGARVTIFSDYVCPFCYLEEPDLARVREEYGEAVEVGWRAYELRPDPIPTLDPDGEYLHRVWNASVYPMAKSLGMTLRLPPVQPRSRKALEAAEYAREEGKFDEMHTALFRAFFEDGKDIGTEETLLEVGASVGLDRDKLRAALEEKRYRDKVLDDEQLARRLRADDARRSRGRAAPERGDDHRRPTLRRTYRGRHRKSPLPPLTRTPLRLPSVSLESIV